jgi:ferritin-like metal-binding protein YciE
LPFDDGALGGNMTQQQAVLSWLKDAHAMEVGAIPTLKSHAAAAGDYPDLQVKLNEHIDVTRRHVYLIEGCIERLGGHPSAIKEVVGTMAGKVSGIANLPTKDTVIKNVLGDYAAENFEIASSRSLIAAAEMVGDEETAGVCRRILRDEEEMTGWLGGHIATLTLGFLSGQAGEADESGALSSAGQRITRMGQQGRKVASDSGSKGALVAVSALLMAAGTTFLLSQAFQGKAEDD